MSLIKVKTTTGAVMLIDTAHVIAVVDETNTKGYKPEMGTSVLFLFGGLSIRTSMSFSDLSDAISKELGKSIVNLGELSNETISTTF